MRCRKIKDGYYSQPQEMRDWIVQGIQDKDWSDPYGPDRNRGKLEQAELTAENAAESMAILLEILWGEGLLSLNEVSHVATRRDQEEIDLA